MKKCCYALMVMLMALVSVGLTACGSDEPELDDIVGTWQYDNPDETAGFDLFYLFTKDGVFHIVEKSHETYIGRPNFFVHHGTYTVSGTKLKTTFYGDEVVTTESNFSVQGDRLMFFGEDESASTTFTRVEDSVIEPYLQNI